MINHFFCDNCKTVLPFGSVDDEEFECVVSNSGVPEHVRELRNDWENVGLGINGDNLEWHNVHDPESNFFNEYNWQCEYYVDPDFVDKFRNTKGFSIIHFNARSLRCNFLVIREYVAELNIKFDAIAISESWLNKTDDITLYELEGYTLFNTMRDINQGGGVTLYVRTDHNAIVVNNLSCEIENVLESITIEIVRDGRPNIVVNCTYRNPGVPITESIDFFERLSKSIRRKEAYICGDFNINLIKHSEHRYTSQFVNLLYSYGFFPTITKIFKEKMIF